LENAMKQSPFIEQIMVVGEGQKLVAAIIQPNFAFIKEWGKRHGINLSDNYDEISKHPKVNERVQKEIDKYNQDFGKWEKIKLFRLTPDEWSVESGHLTPTMKLKRKIIKEKYQHLYNDIYDNL